MNPGPVFLPVPERENIMPQPKVSRPHFPPGYLENPRTLLDWAPVELRLAAAKN